MSDLIGIGPRPAFVRLKAFQADFLRGIATMNYSVVIPARNASRFLPAALASVGMQTLPPAEVIVIDDGSTDDTAHIAAAHGASVITHDIARGPAAARNAGVRAASSEFIAFLDADDEWTADHAHATVTATAQHGVVFAAGRAMRIGELSGAVRTTSVGSDPLDIRDALVLDNPIIQSGAVIRREVFHAAGGYDDSLRLAEDYDLWNRVAEHGLFCPVPHATVRRRMHDEQLSTQSTSAMVSSAWTVRRRTVARRRFFDSMDAQGSHSLRLLRRAAAIDLNWVLWTGNPSLLRLVRDEVERTDREFDFRGALAGVIGLPVSLTRLAHDLWCRAYGVRARFRGRDGILAT